jgi:hypothetical protein
VGHANRLALDAQLLGFAKCGSLSGAFVEHDVDVSCEVADEQVELAVAVPIDGKDGGDVRTTFTYPSIGGSRDGSGGNY